MSEQVNIQKAVQVEGAQASREAMVLSQITAQNEEVKLLNQVVKELIADLKSAKEGKPDLEQFRVVRKGKSDLFDTDGFKKAREVFNKKIGNLNARIDAAYGRLGRAMVKLQRLNDVDLPQAKLSDAEVQQAAAQVQASQQMLEEMQRSLEDQARSLRDQRVRIEESTQDTRGTRGQVYLHVVPQEKQVVHEEDSSFKAVLQSFMLVPGVLGEIDDQAKASAALGHAKTPAIGFPLVEPATND